MYFYGTEYLEIAHLGLIPRDYKNGREVAFRSYMQLLIAEVHSDGLQCV